MLLLEGIIEVAVTVQKFGPPMANPRLEDIRGSITTLIDRLEGRNRYSCWHGAHVHYFAFAQAADRKCAPHDVNFYLYTRSVHWQESVEQPAQQGSAQPLLSRKVPSRVK